MSSGVTEHFLNESQWLDMDARIRLARRVNAMLQCGCYTQHHVYMYFAALRRRKHSPAHRCPNPIPQCVEEGTVLSLYALHFAHIVSH